jgi:ABC-2 type transport system permease protein
MMLKYLLEKEFKQFARHSFLPKLTVAFPVMIMLVVPWITTMDIKDISIVVVDLDRSALSADIVHDIDGSPYFDLKAVLGDQAEALKMVELGESDAMVEIPADFEKNLVNTGSAPIQLSINTVNGTRGVLGASYLGTLMANYQTQTVPSSSLVPKISLSVQNRFNPLLDYKVFMIPALMVIILIVMCGFLPTLNIVSEKERGTMEQMNVTPVSKTAFIIAKLIPYWLMGMLILAVCMALAYFVYGLYPKGNVLIIILFAILFILTISGFGLVVSNNSNTMQQAMFVMFFFVMFFQLMSGLLTPIRSMPDWAQWITYLAPPRYFIEMMRLVYLKGGYITDLMPQLLALVAFVVFFGVWAVVSYRKRDF